jgi:lipopolysaccharide transport system permease protein
MQELLIEAGRSERGYWKDVWRFRELLYFLAWRDLLVRYKQTVIGVVWALVRPLATMLILTIVFGRVAKLPSGGVAYPLVVLCGLLPWQFFATVLSESGSSLINNTGLISKIYFPRLLVPASSLVTSLVEFGISLAFLVGLMIWYHHVPGPQIAAVPFFFVLLLALAFGAGLWVSSLMVRYRDFRHIVPFAIQFGLYLSPVGFTDEVIPETWRLLYALNPMVGVIDGFRWSILGGEHVPHWSGLIVSSAVVVILLVSGVRHFRNVEDTFADEI